MTMCFGGRDRTNSGAARSHDIDRTLRQDEKRLSKEIKLLLLGKFCICARKSSPLIARPLHARTRQPFVSCAVVVHEGAAVSPRAAAFDRVY